MQSSWALGWGQGPRAPLRREAGAGRGMFHLNGTGPHLVPGAGGNFDHFKEDNFKPGVARAVAPFVAV